MAGKKHRDHSDHVSLMYRDIRDTTYGVGACWVLGRPSVALMAKQQKWVTSPQEAGDWLVRHGLTADEANTMLGEFVLTYCKDEAWVEAINALAGK